MRTEPPHAWRRHGSRPPKPTSRTALRLAPRQRDGAFLGRSARRSRARIATRRASASRKPWRASRCRSSRGSPCRTSSRASDELAAAERVVREALAIEPNNTIAVTQARRARPRARRCADRDRQRDSSARLGSEPERSRSSCSASRACALSIRPLPKARSTAAVELEPDAPLPRLGLALDFDSPRRLRRGAARSSSSRSRSIRPTR